MIVYIQELDDRYVVADAAGNVIDTFELNDYVGMINYLEDNNYRLSSCSSVCIPSLMA
jgi:hypothetical protein